MSFYMARKEKSFRFPSVTHTHKKYNDDKKNTGKRNKNKTVTIHLKNNRM